jgi:hypothetical protein
MPCALCVMNRESVHSGKVSVDDKWSALNIVYMHAGETKLHTYVNHSVTRMRHGRETRTSVATLDLPPVRYIHSQRKLEVFEVSDTTAVSCAIRVPDIPAIDPMPCGTCEESCFLPNNFRHVVSKFSTSCGKKGGLICYLCEIVNAVATLVQCSTTACPNPSQLQTLWMMIYVSTIA